MAKKKEPLRNKFPPGGEAKDCRGSYGRVNESLTPNVSDRDITNRASASCPARRSDHGNAWLSSWTAPLTGHLQGNDDDDQDDDADGPEGERQGIDRARRRCDRHLGLHEVVAAS